MGKLNILFSIEGIHRELDFRLFLAVMCAERNRRIFVAQHDIVHKLVRFMRNGIYLGKSVFPRLAVWETGKRYQLLKERQFSVIYLDEEGGMFRGEEPDWERNMETQLDVNRLGEEDYLCAWGDFQRNFYVKQSPLCAKNIHSTGHPRFDLNKLAYRRYFQTEVSRLKRKYAPFILFNTNLALANPRAGLDYSFADFNHWDVRDPKKRILHIKDFSHQWNILTSFLSLANRLSIEFPHARVLIRPHPSENFDFYRTIFRGIPNVETVHEGPVTPWLFACRALIHNGCTTGVEAYLGGANVIAYKPVESIPHDPYLPNILGIQCHNEDQAVERVRSILDSDEEPISQPLPPRALSLLANFEADSFQRVRAILTECEATLRSTDGEFNEAQFAMSDAWRRVVQGLKDAARPRIPALFSGKHQGQKWAEMFSQMFFGFDEADLRRRLARISRFLQKEVNLRFHGPALFTVETN